MTGVVKIKTLVELFDECQIENVIAALRYKPEKLIYVGYKKTMTTRRKTAIERFLKMKGVDISIEYEIVGGNDYTSIVDKLSSIADNNEDCYFDITGGKELILAAIGAVSMAKNVPMIQFNIRSGNYVKLYGDGELSDTDIPFLKIDEIVTLNGGAVIKNEPDDYDWELTDEFVRDIENMWSICKRNCGLWNIQSAVFENLERFGRIDAGLNVYASLTHMERIKRDAYLDKRIIPQLTKMGLITDFCCENDIVTFTYKDEQIRRCLTKAGNILELYAYSLLKEISANDPGYYDDIDIGVYVDWDGEIKGGANAYETKNEVDIIVMRDAVPIFISCKNGEAKKEALYELDTVANHFGGAYVKKVLLTTYISSDAQNRRYLLQRARDMNIDVIENVDKMDREEFIRTLKKRIK